MANGRGGHGTQRCRRSRRRLACRILSATTALLVPFVFLVAAPGGLPAALAADSVPTDIQQPGTQPGQVGTLESPDKCDNCHGGYGPAVEPARNWRGSMMAHAGRDPIFWATLAISEQDFLPGSGGAGDLCLRCHSPRGWLAGRSTPTDGSGLQAGDADGVTCDLCHKLTNPDGSELRGTMVAPFVANETDPSDPFDWNSPNGVEGYYGSGMFSVWNGSEKLGPFSDAAAPHAFLASSFHRDRDFCGTCHDVSNPAVGNLAPHHGAQATADAVIADETVGGPVSGKAAFRNPPYAYGIVERTFSEYKAAQVAQTLVEDYDTLPLDLRAGALEAAYDAATHDGTTNPNYTNPPAPRYFSCQTCHMPPVTGVGCNKKGAPLRTNLPLHDMTGGNYWMPLAIEYLDARGELRLGGGISADETAAMDDGALRAKEQLRLAATLSLSADGRRVKVINHTGHKLISGYPEGRRMWLDIRWYDAAGALVREDGAYGPIGVSVTNPAGGPKVAVQSILDLEGTNTRIYEAHMGISQEWAARLVSLGYDPDLPLGYDRMTNQPEFTLGELAVSAPGTAHESFRFVLNDTVVRDNRIPPFGMTYEAARVRNVLPVPATQYGGGPTYDYFDEVTLNAPAGAVHATIDLLYQPTSWEFIQFLYLANDETNAFLEDEGENMLEAWLNTGMAKPYIMASVAWDGAAPTTTTTTSTTSTTILMTTTSTTPTTSTTTSTTTTTTTTTSTTTSTTVLPPSPCGDFDGNGHIQTSDALQVLRTSVGQKSCELCVCDLDGSGSTSVVDALIDLKIAVGVDLPLACPPCG